MFLTRKQTKTLKTMRYSGLLCSTAIIRYAEKNSVSTEKLCNWSRKQTFLSLIIQYQISSLRFIYLFIYTDWCLQAQGGCTHCIVPIYTLFSQSWFSSEFVVSYFFCKPWCCYCMLVSDRKLRWLCFAYVQLSKIPEEKNCFDWELSFSKYIRLWLLCDNTRGGWWHRSGTNAERVWKQLHWLMKIYLKCVHIKPLTTWWKHFLTLLPSSFLILPLQIPWSYFCFPIGCWLELLGKRPFHPNKPTEREGCTAVTSHLQIRAARVLCLMKTVSSSVLLFKIMHLSDFSDLVRSFPLTVSHSCFSGFVRNLFALECDGMCRHCHL